MRRYEYGDLVVDREAEEPSIGVVVNRPATRAGDWEIRDGETTVAEENPEYPADSPLVVVVHQDDLEAYDPDWESFDGEDRSLVEFAEAGVPYYAFPEARVKPVPDRVMHEQIDPTPATEALLERLKQGGMTCLLEDEETIRAEKLGKEYILRPGELVDGEGVLRDRLETVVKQHSPSEASG